MTDPQLQSLIEAAEAYEALFVPALFGEWAPRVAEVADVRAGHRVLDVACGTGVLAREIAARLGDSGSVVGLDPGLGMLAVARRLAPESEWRRGEAEKLPLPDAAFDRVVSQFGLMFFADPLRALREMVRVTRPGGRLVVTVWDRLESNPAYAAEVELLARTAGGDAADAVRIPFALGDPRRLEGMFRDAGARSVDVTRHAGRGTFPSVRAMVEAEVRGWLPAAGVPLSEERIAEVLGEAEEALAPYVTGAGTVQFETSALIVSAERPG